MILELARILRALVSAGGFPTVPIDSICRASTSVVPEGDSYRRKLHRSVTEILRSRKGPENASVIGIA